MQAPAQLAIDDQAWDRTLDAIYRCADPVVDLSSGRAAIDAFLNPSQGAGFSAADDRKTVIEALQPHLTRVLEIRATLEALRANRTNPTQLILAMARPAGVRTGAGEVIMWNHAAKALAFQLKIDLELRPKDWQSECRQAVRDGTAALDLGQGLIARLAHLSSATRASTGMASAYGLETVIVELVRSAPAPIIVQISLTTAERDIVSKLRAGVSITDIATTRGTSLATVRRQIKLLKAKTGQKTLASLASLSL
jgi:DNA-binding CsgD family transcriptional regulator